MLKKYKNGFMDIIQSQGLNPADFNTSEDEYGADCIFRIRFMDTGLVFVLSHRVDQWHQFRLDWTTFDDCFPPDRSCGMRAGITLVYDHFRKWLMEQVKPCAYEITQPDLWQQLQQQKQLVSADPLTDYETSPFTEPEKEQLRVSVQQFRVLILESFSPTQEQLQAIDQKLDYLAAAVDRPINRFDWKGIALSTVIAIGIQLTLDTDRGRQLFELFKQALAVVLHLLPES